MASRLYDGDLFVHFYTNPPRACQHVGQNPARNSSAIAMPGSTSMPAMRLSVTSALMQRAQGVRSGRTWIGGLFDLAAAGFRDPILVAATDGVGTKLELARAVGTYRGLGIDLVAMCVNDLIAQGAIPLFFLDYFATGKLDRAIASEVVAGIADGCVECEAALIGGETAEMPGVIRMVASILPVLLSGRPNAAPCWHVTCRRPVMSRLHFRLPVHMPTAFLWCARLSRSQAHRLMPVGGD